MRNIPIVTTLALAAALSACADRYEHRAGAPATTSPPALSGAPAAAAPAARALDAADRMFIVDAALGGMAEVELGRMAQERATLPQVREFGRRMVQEHGQANQELMRIAARLGVTPTTASDPARAAARDALQRLTGREFDRQYVEQQFTDHAVLLTAFQMAAQRADDNELRAFAGKTAPAIQQHMDILRSIWDANFPGS